MLLIFGTDFLRPNFSIVACYSSKLTRGLLQVVKLLVTRCKICLLLVAEVACCKKSLVTRCEFRLLVVATNHLLLSGKNHQSLVKTITSPYNQVKDLVFFNIIPFLEPKNSKLFKVVNLLFESVVSRTFSNATIQFVIFKPLSFCFKETIEFEVKASFASRSVLRLIN